MIINITDIFIVCMDFLINEIQLKRILQEQDESKMTNYMKELYSFTREIINKVSKKYKLNLSMLLTWGASIGGLMMPLDNYIKTNNFEITDYQRALVLLGVVSFLFFENKRMFSKIYEKIKSENVEEAFDQSLSKGMQLKEAFLNFLSSTNIGISSFMDSVSYAFIVPILDDIMKIANGSQNLNEAAKIITERLVLSGVVGIGSTAVYTMIKKLLRKFKR